MAWRIYQYILHLFHTRHRKGHGIHSPYLFEFVSEVLFNAKGVPAPGDLLKEHRKLRSKYLFVRRSSVSQKYGLLLYRIARWFRPEMIIELGTGMGVSTLYLTCASPGTPLHTIEGDRERADMASQLINSFCPGAVSIHCGSLDQKLKEVLPLIPQRFLAFVDGNHYQEPTVAYVRNLLEKAGNEAIIVMDDIYWSRGMQRAWREVLSWSEVRMSVDLFHMGIILLRKDLHKAEIKIKF